MQRISVSCGWFLACSALDEQTRDGGAHKDGAARYKNRI